uniref:GP2 n=1 Tax=Porcine reproductive and respiratory syndrome virus TaxID=28344 RepID=A0A1V0CPJ7_PRRSV|nr:glycoprotein 2 [Porcine reproductive and respiratory syndrome virus]QWM97632.1 GP2 [Porcine reproductive and respiratory syndrome virus]UNS08224.1 GP2 [Porcine reproductive and respiratory syndrome virus]
MKWGPCKASLTKSASFLWTLSLSSWFPLLISLYFCPFCSASPSPDGWWYFASDWFAPRYSVRALPFTLSNYRRSYEAYLSQCRGDIPAWGIKHPLGMLWHHRVSTLIDEMVSRRMYRIMDKAGQAAWKQVVSEATLSRISGLDVVAHFQHLAAIEAETCKYLASRLPMLHNLRISGSNVTIVYNSTLSKVFAIFPTPGSRPKLHDFQQWLVAVHSSIFSSVAASCTLFFVLWLRMPILRTVFGFHWLGAIFPSSSW